jgi:hypothetical protein
MAEGLCAGSERQGAGHSDREDETGRCGRKSDSRLEPEKRGDTPEVGVAGAMTFDFSDSLMDGFMIENDQPKNV